MKLYEPDVAFVFEPTGQYVIPLFQRHYVWDKDGQWRPLWEDIIGQVARRATGKFHPNTRRHFTGAIVIQRSQSDGFGTINTYEIIDGQQRLTTFQVILCAMRDACKHIGVAEPEFASIADDAQKHILNTGRHVHDDGQFKLLPTEYDRPAFKAMVSEQPLPDSGSKIVVAYRYFNSEIQRFIKRDASKASSLLDAIKNDFGFVSIQIDEDDAPELIFESLNKGEPLLQFDLLRNNLFLRTRQSAGENRNDLYAKYWRHFEDDQWERHVGSGRRTKALSELFLQHFLSAKLATDKVEPLFRTYQKEYQKTLGDGTHTIESELMDLHKYSKIYEDIIAKSDDAANRAYDFLGITTLRPFMLYLVAEAGLSGEQGEHVFHALDSYTMRRAICTTQKLKNFNKFFPELIKRLREKTCPVPAVFELLRDEEDDTNKWPLDREVLIALSGHWESVGVSTKLMRHILRRMEWRMRQNDRRHEGDEPPVLNDLTLEHILPEKWWQHWLLPSKSGRMVKWEDIISDKYKRDHPDWNDDYPPEGAEDSALANKAYKKSLDTARERAALMWSIGNLTLLTQPLNSTASNRPFHEKKKLMDEHSTLLLNNDIRRETNWDVAEIKNRTKRLHGLFCKIWPDPQWFLDNMPPE